VRMKHVALMKLFGQRYFTFCSTLLRLL
jgi:hypothetical protein